MEGRRVLILRSEPGAARSASAVHARGWQPIVSPLLEVRRTGRLAPEDLTDVQALAFTSAAAVRALVEDVPGLSLAPSLRVFCVGDATAAEARATGLSNVESAAGDAEALAQRLSRLDPADGVVLHLRGAHVARPLKLEALRLRSRELYAAQRLDRVSEEAEAALRAARPEAPLVVLLHSRRISEAFFAAASIYAPALDLCALSARCAEPWTSAPLAALRVASAPNEASLLELLDATGSAGAFR